MQANNHSESMKRSFYLLRLFAFIAVITVAFSSCKKSDTDEATKEYMEGSVSYSIPAYIHKGETITMTVSGITNPANPTYKWLIPEIYSDTLTSATVTVTFPDSLYTLTVTAIATYPEYYNSSSSRTVTIVDTAREGSLKGLKYGKTMVDHRDGTRYYTTEIGHLEWFAQNLAYDGVGVSFNNSPATKTLFGIFYHWDEATGGVSGSGLGGGPQGVCPQGWSIPTNEDWEDLGKALNDNKEIPFVNDWLTLGEKVTVDAYFNGDRLWPYSPDNKNANMFGWNAIPLGNTQMDHGAFRGSNEYAFWWSSTEKNETKAYYRYIYYDRSSFPMNYTSKDDFGASIRCVRLIEK